MRVFPLQKQNYDLIDPIIREWASENSVQLYTEFKDVEVRSALFCDNTGAVRFQIGIAPIDDDGNAEVQMYETKKLIRGRKAAKPTCFTTSAANLRQILDDVTRSIKSKLV